MKAGHPALEPGVPYPMGATWDGSGVNFAVYSAHAERIEVCLFDATGAREIARLPLPECTDGIWHGYLAHALLDQPYGYRAYGPYDPNRGHRFNPHKLLLDPYARRITGEVHWCDALHGYRMDSPRGDLSFDRRDSAPWMPKALVTAPLPAWEGDVAPRTPWSRTVIYEAHLRGLSAARTDLMMSQRGSFAALGDPRVVDHLVALGITAVELLPVHARVSERALVERGLRNYWGYNTLGFLVPEPAYLSGGGLSEIRTAVQRLHRAGIEVILDVVYNHTGEGNEQGPTLSLRGLDNASYYRLVAGDARRYVNDSGCGNTLDLSQPAALRLVMDSLRYWVQEFHIDGFRFDLCTTLGREAHGFDPGAGFFDALRQDPILAPVKLIVEPWDLGLGGYQLGRHPTGLAEWNDRFRDDTRRFWRGDDGLRGALAARLHGSADLFDHDLRRPWASVNFITAHDGFTLADLVSFTQRQNLANGEDNRDGTGENWSANWGEEGPTEDADVRTQRARIQRALLTTLLCASGTPMLLAGDEFGRTQHGNNNAYCQDNALSWLDWRLLDTSHGRALCSFTARLIATRARLCTLRPAHWAHGQDEPVPGISDIAWFDEHGAVMTPEIWQNPEGRRLALRRAARTPAGPVEVTLLLINGAATEQCFALPAPALAWQWCLDSADPERPEHPLPGEGEGLTVAAHSAVLLVAYVSPAPGYT